MRILLITKDTAQYTNWFPHGIAYLAAVLLKEGYDVEVYSQDIHHYPDEHLTDYLNKNHFDVVGVGVIGGYYQYRKLLKISNAINNSKQRPFYIIGGNAVSPEPEYFLRKTKANVIVMGEGEVTIIELLEAVASLKSFSSIKGIAFWEGDNVVINEERELINDIDTIPFPAFHLFPVNFYRLIRMPYTKRTEFAFPVISGRGCPFKCTFCYRMDKGFRPRNNEAVIEEIKFLQKDYDISYICFADELLMSSTERTVDLCRDFIKSKLNINWYCFGRLNFAKPETLKLMKQAGCVCISYGIEAMDDEVLRNMRKGLTVKQIINGIESTFESGISPGFNLLFGNIGDNKETLNKAVEFLLKYDDCAELRTIKPVTPYPGSPLYNTAIKKEFLKDCEDFYENKHLNSDLLTINFTDLSDSEFHRCLYEANSKILTNYYNHQLSTSVEQGRKLYIDKDSSFRGFRQR